MQSKDYDVIVIGGGPAGYSAALYCSRAGMSVLVIEKLSAGGQMATTQNVDNYPGFYEGIDGFELGQRMQKSAENFGTETLISEVTEVSLTGNKKHIITTNGTFVAKAVILACGAKPRKIGLHNEEKLIGKGVAYCATCDGMFYKEKTAVVVGGGNSALADALFLSKICKKVYVVHRRDKLSASRYYYLGLKEFDNVEFIFNTKLDEILEDDKVKGVILKNLKTATKTKLNCDVVFIAIGRVPDTSIFKGQVDMDNTGYIIADESTKTNLPGVYAVGDLRTKVLRQIVTAAADGAVASKYVEKYLFYGQSI